MATAARSTVQSHDTWGAQPLEVADIADAQAAKTAWDAAQTDCTGQQGAARVAVRLKGDCRETFEVAIRALVRQFQISADVSDEERRALGITVGNGSAPGGGFMAPPPSRSIGTVNTSQRLGHEIRFVDEGTPTRQAQPAGAMGCAIWAKIGTAPTDPSELSFLALARTSPHITEYSGADAGKTVHYMLRWVTTRGETGPWSEPVVATITHPGASALGGRFARISEGGRRQEPQRQLARFPGQPLGLARFGSARTRAYGCHRSGIIARMGWYNLPANSVRGARSAAGSPEVRIDTWIRAT